MRVYCFVMLRGCWFTQCLLAEDMQTSISGFRYFEAFDMVLKALSYLGATEREMDELIERTEGIGRGHAPLLCSLRERTCSALSRRGCRERRMKQV